MRAFVLQHIDSLAMMLAGALMAGWALRRRDRLKSASNWFIRKSHALSLILVAIGLLFFLSECFHAYSWVRVFTADNVASVEFPERPKFETATEVVDGISTKQETFRGSVFHRDITLFLTRNELPSIPAMNREQRVDHLKSFFQQQGFLVISCTAEGQANRPVYRIVVEKNGGKVRAVIKVVFKSNCLYRAVAASTEGFHDDPVIGRFINSFVAK